ncbi:hypothetical protein [Acinetobacter gyllenbergii]
MGLQIFGDKFAEFKEKTRVEVIQLETEFISANDESAEFFIFSMLISADL